MEIACAKPNSRPEVSFNHPGHAHEIPFARPLPLRADQLPARHRPCHSSPEGWVKRGIDTAATGEWWNQELPEQQACRRFKDIPRDEVASFALYTVHRKVLKLTAQFYPPFPDEEFGARLEIERDGQGVETERARIQYPGWSAQFRIYP